MKMKNAPKVILLCGKIAAGKTFYARRLASETCAVILSCDELMLTLFPLPAGAGELHDLYAGRVQKYLFRKSLDLLASGCSVILDWGFWTKTSRDEARAFFRDCGIPCELHYIDVSDEQWEANIRRRNRAVEEGRESAYFMDEGLRNKLAERFVPPESDETDVRYFNNKEATE